MASRGGSHKLASIGLGATVIAAFGVASTPVQAQYSSLEDRVPRYAWRGNLRADFLREFETKTDGGDEFEAWRVGLSGGLGGPINRSLLVGLDFGYRRTDYSFRLDNGPGRPTSYGTNELPRPPWGGLDTIDLAPSLTVLIGRSWSIVAAVPIRRSAEVGARSNAFSAGASAILRWQISDTLRVGAGIGVTSQLEASAETFPIVSLDWQVQPDLVLQTEGSWVQGGRTSLLYGPNPAVRLALSLGWERNRFRLDDNGAAADRNGVGEVTAVPIELGLRLQLFEGARFDFRAGFAFAGRFRIEDAGGRKLYDQEYDPSPRVGVALTLPLRLP